MSIPEESPPTTRQSRKPVPRILAAVVALQWLGFGAVMAWRASDQLKPECVGSLSPDGRLMLEGCDEDYERASGERYVYILASADVAYSPGSGPTDDQVMIGFAARAPDSFARWRDGTTVSLCGLGVTVRDPLTVAVRDAAGDLRRVTIVTGCG